MGWTPSGGRSRPCRAARSHTADTASASTMTGKSWRGLASGPRGAGRVCSSGAGGHSPGGEVGHRSWVLRASWPDSSGLGFVLNLMRIPGGVLAKESPRPVFSERAHRLLPGQSAFGEAREAASVSGGCCVWEVEWWRVGSLLCCLGWGVQGDAWADGRGWRKQRAWQWARARVSF